MFIFVHVITNIETPALLTFSTHFECHMSLQNLLDNRLLQHWLALFQNFIFIVTCLGELLWYVSNTF